MKLMWMRRGPRAGTLVEVNDEDADEIVQAGDGQLATAPAHTIKPAEYGTKEMRASINRPTAKRASKRTRKGADNAMA